nr:bifunctional pinoresinol-lariciresinol reductase 2 [Tanacetum cinerariifolium]
IGSFNDHRSLVEAVKQVDIVICAISGVHIRSHQILLQLKLVDAIKEAGNIKRFLPSEFGTDPGAYRLRYLGPRVTFDDKMVVRKAIEEAGIPFTYVSANCFAGYMVGGLCQPGHILPSRESVTLFGDGNKKYDPRTLNKTVYIRPPANILSQREVVKLWEKLIGKELEKSSLSEQEFLSIMKDQGYAEQVGLTHYYHVYYDGCLTNFETGDDAEEACHTPKSLIMEIHHGGCFTPIRSRSYVGGHVSSVNVDDNDEFCLHDLKDMVVKLVYGLAELIYYHFLIPRLGLDYGLHLLNVDADVLEMAKYVKDYKIILVYVEHESSIFVTPKKRVSLLVDNHLRKGPIEIDSGPDITGNEITGKQMVVHVGNSSTVDDVLDLEMLFETEGVGPIGKFKEVEVDADNESKEDSDTEGDYTGGSDSEDSNYDPKHDEVFDGDEHIVDDVRVSMNNFRFTADPEHDISIGVVDIQEDDLDDIDYDSFGSDLDDGIDSERRIQLRELRRIYKHKNINPNKYYFYLGQQFDSKERVTGRVKMHLIETRRKLIMVKNDKERVRVRCEGTISALVPYVSIETYMGKNEFSQTKGGLVIRENNTSGTQNILRKDKTCHRKGKKVNKQKKVDKYSCPWTMLVAYTNEGALKQGFRACGIEILGLDGRFMSGPWPCQILTAVRVDANNGIYLVAYAIIEAESKRQIHENMKSQFKGGVYKEMLWNATKSTSIGRAKCDLLLNSICEVFNRQLVNGRDQPIITCLEYVREYLMKRIVVVQKVKYTTCLRIQWELLYLNNRFMLPTDLKHGHMYTHSRKGCRGQGGATQAGGFSARNVSSQGGVKRTTGARNASSQASARQAAGAKTVFGQAGGTSNVSSQSSGSSKPIAEQTSTGAMNASIQPNAAPSTTSQGPTQHNARPRQGF